MSPLSFHFCVPAIHLQLLFPGRQEEEAEAAAVVKDIYRALVREKKGEGKEEKEVDEILEKNVSTERV